MRITCMRSTLRTQVRGEIVAVSEVFTILMHGPAPQVTPAPHTVYGSAPRRPVHEREDFAISLFANSGSERVDGFQFRVLYDPARIAFQRIEQSSFFVCAPLPIPRTAKLCSHALGNLRDCCNHACIRHSATWLLTAQTLAPPCRQH